jgi:hypothetical protein
MNIHEYLEAYIGRDITVTFRNSEVFITTGKFFLQGVTNPQEDAIVRGFDTDRVDKFQFLNRKIDHVVGAATINDNDTHLLYVGNDLISLQIH